MLLPIRRRRQSIRLLKIWNKSYVLGTDNLGRDILTRLMYGTRVSLMVAFVAAYINMVIGILFGGISGYAGGMVDTVMMRIVDIISTIPLTLYVIPDYGPSGPGNPEYHHCPGNRVLGRYGQGGPGAGVKPSRSRNLSWRPKPSAHPRKRFCLNI